MKPKIAINTHQHPKYAIVNENGKVLEKFRLKLIADQMINYYKNKYFPMELKVVNLI
jgi:hypothetical protein